MSQILVTGSSAIDHIMTHEDKFGNSIDKDKIDNLSVAFLVHKLKKESGGTGLNIAYNLALLEENAILVSNVGRDFEFDSYVKKNINLDYVKVSENLFSAGGYIINDNSGNQITAFHPGAMDEAIDFDINTVTEDLSYAIVSPNQKIAMIKYLEDLNKKGTKTFFDPGQQLFAFDKEELEKCLNLATYLIVNEYEYSEIKAKTGLEERDILNLVDKIILTLGANGSMIISKNEIQNIESVKVGKVVDPTGAGDAYRGGLLYGLNQGLTWENAAQIGTILGSYCVGQNGGQNHIFDKKTLENDLKKYFN